MAKQPAPKSRTTVSKPSAQAPAAPLIPDRWLPWIPVVIGVLVFSTGLTNQLLGIDDHTATVDNPAVRDFKIFSSFNLGMYAPLTWAGYAVAYILGKDSPFWYHLLSMVVHAVNIFLVFQLMLRLDTGKKTALAVALLFAIHPIQVESVAWIAGFSTPLFSMFYLLACLRYLDYTKQPEQILNYWLALLMFVLACLAKSAAVTLPLSFMVFDLWRKPALSRTRQWMGYAPFLLISLGFGLLTLFSRDQTNAMVETPGVHFNALERLQVLFYTPVWYWYKLLLPFKLNIYYSFDQVNGQFPWPYFVAPLVVAGALFSAWRYRSTAPWAWFGLLFFFANVSVMLPYFSHGTFEFCADHYNYLAMIGICFLLVQGWQTLQAKWQDVSGLLRMAGYAWLVMLAVLSLRQIRVWKDTNSVVSNAIDKGYYQNGLMYAARGKELGSRGKVKEAIQDFDKSLEINPEIYESYKFRGDLYGAIRQYEKSVADLNIYLQHFPNDAEQYFNRGLSHYKLKHHREAIADYDKCLELNPGFAQAYLGRSNAYNAIGEAAKAEADLKQFEKLQTEGKSE